MLDAEGEIVELPAGTYDLTEVPLPAGGSRFLRGAGARTTTITGTNRSRVVVGQRGQRHDRSGVDDLRRERTCRARAAASTWQRDGARPQPTARRGQHRRDRRRDLQRRHAADRAGHDRLATSRSGEDAARRRAPRSSPATRDLLDATISTNFSDATGASLVHDRQSSRCTTSRSSRPTKRIDPTQSSGGIQQALDQDSDVTVGVQHARGREPRPGTALGPTERPDPGALRAWPTTCSATSRRHRVRRHADRRAGSAGIGELGDNGGRPTRTILPTDSPAIGRGGARRLRRELDQRGSRGRSASTAATSAPTKRAPGADGRHERPIRNGLCTESDSQPARSGRGVRRRPGRAAAPRANVRPVCSARSSVDREVGGARRRRAGDHADGGRGLARAARVRRAASPRWPASASPAGTSSRKTQPVEPVRQADSRRRRGRELDRQRRSTTTWPATAAASSAWRSVPDDRRHGGGRRSAGRRDRHGGGLYLTTSRCSLLMNTTVERRTRRGAGGRDRDDRHRAPDVRASRSPNDDLLSAAQNGGQRDLPPGHPGGHARDRRDERPSTR